MTITWKRNLPLPMARPRYYDYEYLRADDLTQALDYLLARQNLAARLLRPTGVVSGLELTPTGSDVTVGQGVAIDGDGLVVVLPESRRTTLPGDGTFVVWVEYHEYLSDPRDEGGWPRRPGGPRRAWSRSAPPRPPTPRTRWCWAR
ncbi:hypothetical protein [Micromonospora sp. ATA51]|uniref:hypothetical protein n=1 Tax=Micromonospora sp. ATA51 TaxID=2806098 RepID=UPI001A4671CD|nr:hypothetical protein [Micromonospora sp. ATA51]MBM0227716.1 hypothetical protein [Micromonospora sp. ATA51]